MKTIQSMSKSLVAIAIMFACSMPAHAQFGKIGKAIKNTAKGTVEAVANKATEKGKEKARKKMWEIVKKKVLGGSHMPELPWIMDEGTSKDYVFPPQGDRVDKSLSWYIFDLNKADPAEVQAMKDKLDARFQANKKILMANSTGVFSQLGGYTSSLIDEVQKEQERWMAFYGELQQYMVGRINGTAKDLSGTGGWELTTQMGDIMAPGDKRMFYVARKNGGKSQLYSIDHRGAFATATDVEKLNEEIHRMNNIAILTKGLTNEWDDEYTRESERNKLALIHLRALTFSNLVGEAVNNNSMENLEKAPMPKAGKMNASLKAKALAIAKADDPSVIDVVITSNSWEVKPLTRRIVYGYVIKKGELGKQAVSRSWCQDYAGGGKYGALRHFGVGLESFYVK